MTQWLIMKVKKVAGKSAEMAQKYKKDGLKINTSKTSFMVSSKEKVTTKGVDCNNVELE